MVVSPYGFIPVNYDEIHYDWRGIQTLLFSINDKRSVSVILYWRRILMAGRSFK
jgi:hypothetical protein